MRHSIEGRRSAVFLSIFAVASAIPACSSPDDNKEGAPAPPIFEQNEPLRASPSFPFRYARPPRDPNVATGDAATVAGKNTFRFAAFGDEAFWGGTLKLHEAIPLGLSAAEESDLVEYLKSI